MLTRAVASLAVVLVVAACRATPHPPPAVAPALLRLERPPALVDDGDPLALASALRASIAFYDRLPPDRVLDFGSDHVSVARMRDALAALARVAEAQPRPDALARELARRFHVYAATSPHGVLFTGYYLPVLEARGARDARFRFPVLGRPADLVTAAPAELGLACAAGAVASGRVDHGRLVPYATRAEIEAGGAPGAAVLAWVDDPVALFFLQIQGTGRLRLPDGRAPLIGFAASNGRPYVSVGKLLVAEGALTADEASMQGIRRWIAAHPEARDRVLQTNPRYVFFRPLAADAIGSLGVAVTAGRTIATDPAIYPAGAPAFVRIAAGDDALTRVVLNQDSGAAIRGPGRVDVFFGEGDEAEARAGRLRSAGELYFLAPRADIR